MEYDDNIDNSMDMIDEIIALLDAFKKAFHGIPKQEKTIHYKGAIVKVTVEIIERFEGVKKI